MIEPVRMRKVRIVGPKKSLEKAVEAMHSAGVVHIEDFRPGKYNENVAYFDTGRPFEKASKLSELLIRVRSLAANMGILVSSYPEKWKMPAEPEKILKTIEVDFSELSEKIKKLDEAGKALQNLEQPLKFVTALKISPKILQPVGGFAVYKGYVDGDFEPQLREITAHYEIFKADTDKKTGFALFVQKEFSEKVQALLEKCNYREMQIPAEMKYKTVDDYEAQKQKTAEKLNFFRKRLEELKNKKAPFLSSYEQYLSGENEKAEVPLRFGETANTFVVEGYVPVGKYDVLAKKMAEKFGKKIYIECSEKEVEFAPTQLQNPSIMGSFEFFLNLYSLPFYKELDPTFLIFLTFPLFFGFMLGDVGYGILTTIVFLIMKYTTKSRVMKGLMNAMLLASIATIAFGFVFGEFFGGPYFGLKPILNREHDINLLILITILVGIIHINLGVLFGFINAKRLHGLKHAIYEKLSWVVLEIGGFLMLFKMADFLFTSLPYQMFVGLGIVLFGLVLLLKGHGAYGIIEVPAFASNILSYVRLFAIGLASVALALVINEMATGLIEEGGFMMVFAVVILVLGHIMNVAIGVIGGFLQALRLHYVEFFTKFYKGEGKRYNPFGGSR